MAVTGVRKVYANQMAKTVFFWPKDWPPVMISPLRAPIKRPKANCTRQQANDTAAMPAITPNESLLCAIALDVMAMASDNATSHR